MSQGYQSSARPGGCTESKNMNVVVVGGGIVGVATAWALSRAGMRVKLIDRRREVAAEASHASAGLMHPGVLAYLDATAMRKSWLKALWASPAQQRWFASVKPSQWRWMREHAAQKRLDLSALNLARRMRLWALSNQVLDNWSAELNLKHEGQQGVLALIQSTGRVQQLAQWLADTPGSEAQLIDGVQAKDIEPAISIAPQLESALYWPAARSVNAALLARQLKAACEQAQVAFQMREVVHALLTENGRVVGVVTENGPWHYDAVVLCAGADSPRLLKPLGLKPALQPIKGYSTTLTVLPDGHGPRHTLIDDHKAVCITPWSDRLRVTAGWELGAKNLDPSPKVHATMNDAFNLWLSGAARFSQAQWWAGWRMSTPDGLPLIGKSGVDGLWLNIGHGNAGVSLACASADLLAAQINGQPSALDPALFSPAR
jgi:D-amino-acid dehydrogenase